MYGLGDEHRTYNIVAAVFQSTEMIRAIRGSTYHSHKGDKKSVISSSSYTSSAWGVVETLAHFWKLSVTTEYPARPKNQKRK